MTLPLYIKFLTRQEICYLFSNSFPRYETKLLHKKPADVVHIYSLEVISSHCQLIMTHDYKHNNVVNLPSMKQL